MSKIPMVGLMAAVAVLAGCEDPRRLQAYCSDFGVGATFNWTCSEGCSVTDPAAAGDGDLFTASAITPDASREVATLRADGAVIPSGVLVGVFVTLPASLSSTDHSFQTFLGGVPQESSNAGNSFISGSQDGADANAYLGMRTTKAFDAVEFTVTNRWDAGETPAVYSVYEICSDGGNS